MFISEQEMKRRLESGKNLSHKFQPKISPSAPKPVYVPAKVENKPAQDPEPLDHNKGLHVIAGTLVRQGEKPKIVAKELGLSVKEVREAAESQDAEISERVAKTVDKIREMALDKMLISLGLMTPDKFIDTPLKDLSLIAANCAKIVEKLNPRDADLSPVQLVVYAPQQREERQYKVVDV